MASLNFHWFVSKSAADVTFWEPCLWGSSLCLEEEPLVLLTTGHLWFWEQMRKEFLKFNGSYIGFHLTLLSLSHSQHLPGFFGSIDSQIQFIMRTNLGCPSWGVTTWLCMMVNRTQGSKYCIQMVSHSLAFILFLLVCTPCYLVPHSLGYVRGFCD